MPKSNKIIMNFDDDFLKIIHEKYDMTYDYYRKSIQGERKGSIALKICRDYNTLLESKSQIIRNFTEKNEKK